MPIHATKLEPCRVCGGKMFVGQSGLICSQCPARIVPFDRSELDVLRREYPEDSIIVEEPRASDDDEEVEVCKVCEGQGRVECDECGGTGVDECPECGHEMKCDVCDGEGAVPCPACGEGDDDEDDEGHMTPHLLPLSIARDAAQPAGGKG